MSQQLSEIRTYLEKITHTENDSNFAGSAYELQLIMKGYEKSAYKYNWPQTLGTPYKPISGSSPSCIRKG